MRLGSKPKFVALCKRLDIKDLNFNSFKGDDLAKYEKIFGSEKFQNIIKAKLAQS